MLALVLLAIAFEFARMGWYGSAVLAVIAALTVIPRFWAFLAGFCIGRKMR